MISLILFNVVFLFAIYSVYRYMFSRPKNFPPGPPKLPFFGSYLFMLILDRKNLQKAATKLCEIYKSNIIGLHLGSTPLVILNDSEKVRKALNHRDFDGKPDILMARLREPDMKLTGLFFTDGDLWMEQRRFALRHLRDYGFARRSDPLEDEMNSEISQYIEILKNGPQYPHEKKYFKEGQMRLPIAFGSVFGNCFFKVMFNERQARDQSGKLFEASEHAFEFQRKTDDYGKMYSLIPSIANWFPETSDYNAARNASIGLYTIFKEMVDEHISTYDETHERNFIDMYIRKMNEAQSANGDETTPFSYDQLLMTCVDISLPALSSLPTTISFLIQQICIEPVIQAKIQEEIDRVVGEGRLPTLDDRVSMPYTEAVLREIMRYETLVPNGLAHKALVDTEFLGYNIPKNTVIVAALSSANHDECVWDEPHKFKPERFLDAHGNLSLKNDVSLPFSAGKRLCAGETFARNMLFLVTTAFFQSFNVNLPPGAPIHEFKDNLNGLIRTPPDHWVQYHAR